MRTLFIACLLISRCALAQLDDVAFVGSLTVASSSPGASINPTNIAGYPALTWYKGDDWYTNSGETWPDRGPNAWNLTQSATSDISTNYLDGQRFVSFNGAGNLGCMVNVNYTNTQPCTWVLLIRIHTNSTSNKPIMATQSPLEIFKMYNLDFGLGLMSAEAGAYLLSANGGFVTNRWQVFEIVWNGASSAIYTNGVAWMTGKNAGTENGKQLKVAGSNFGDQTKCEILEIATYNTNFSAAARSSLYNYFKTNYPSASLP